MVFKKCRASERCSEGSQMESDCERGMEKSLPLGLLGITLYNQLYWGVYYLRYNAPILSVQCGECGLMYTPGNHCHHQDPGHFSKRSVVPLKVSTSTPAPRWPLIYLLSPYLKLACSVIPQKLTHEALFFVWLLSLNIMLLRFVDACLFISFSPFVLHVLYEWSTVCPFTCW